MTIFPSGAAPARAGRSSSAANTNATRHAVMIVVLPRGAARSIEERHGVAGGAASVWVWEAISGPPYRPGSIEGRHGVAGAPRAFGGFGGPFRGPPSGGVRGEPHRLRARLVVGDHVDDGGLARRERPLERGPDVVRLLDELAVRAQVHGHAVVAGVAEVAAGLGQRPAPRRVRRPAAGVADDTHGPDPVAARRVGVPRLGAETAGAVQHPHPPVR